MSDDQPTLRVLRGEPSAEELAVLTAVMTAAETGADEPPPPIRGRWNDPASAHRRQLLPGPGAWRASGS
ncbi:MAG TPA: acyl-CoA carboxylase subunit epsilon [Jatrophihabitans sp.]|jgi:hypothetical protein